MRLLGRVARQRRGLLGVVTLAVTAGVVVVLVLVTGSPSPTAASGAAKAPAGAAAVRRRNLVQTDTEAGTLSYANPQTVYDRLSGTITWLPRVGQVIRPGGTLFRVNGSPVILMDGSAPAYRTLSSADSSGADVLELNRNLAALGFNANGIVVDDEWQAATTLGVELLQESLGETATGSLSLGRVVFLPGPQLVSTVEGTIGDTANGGSPATPASVTADPPAPEFVSLTTSATTTTTMTTSASTSTTPTPTTPTTTTTTTTQPPAPHRKPKKRAAQTPSLAALLALLKAESAQLKAEAEQLKAEQHQNGNAPSGGGKGSGTGGGSGGGKGGTGGGAGGGGGGGSNTGSGGNSPSSGSGGAGSGSTGEAVLETNSNHLVVTVDLDASLQSEAKVGEKVTVQLPAGNTVTGKVTAVSSVAQTGGSGGNGSGGSGSGSGGGSGNGGGSGGGGGGGGNGSASSSTIPVTITLSGHHKGAGLDEAAVSVNFAQARAKNVLSVPVTALLAVSGGNYAVQEAAAPHTMVPVTVGLFAAGYVQISGPGIHPGLQVTDSQG